jgi:hypothetical protein
VTSEHTQEPTGSVCKETTHLSCDQYNGNVRVLTPLFQLHQSEKGALILKKPLIHEKVVKIAIVVETTECTRNYLG